MTSNAKLFRQLIDVSPTSVRLPNGKHAIATKEGTITLSPNMVLTNVLYVPDLTCNLLSVSHLLSNLSYSITFTDKLCIIQDRTLRTLIGADERCDSDISLHNTDDDVFQSKEYYDHVTLYEDTPLPRGSEEHSIMVDDIDAGIEQLIPPLAAITAGIEPTSFKEVVKDPGWRKAMQEEIDALK
ncbi:uncharacterized protein LOC133792468 [Humulus lupulus]|uniref:uncharacterized protein LOC133792468 n=1 Tax=Humulus lupulus TaxID=3486 RepID=UPI002B4119CC|nr:uncharacterized protein LOC133792468 [Humulus lupulus]